MREKNAVCHICCKVNCHSEGKVSKILLFNETTIKKMALLSENSGRSLPDYETQAAKMKSFSPYADNGG